MLDIKEELGLCFIDWEEAFDHVDWTKLLEMFRNFTVNCRERRFNCNLYMRQRVKLTYGESDSEENGRAV